jgi:hypothetical protein
LSLSVGPEIACKKSEFSNISHNIRVNSIDFIQREMVIEMRTIGDKIDTGNTLLEE